MSKFLGKLFGDAPKTSAQAPPKAFTIQVDPSKFNLSIKPDGPVHLQLETLKQKITKHSSNVESNLMLSIRASTKKNMELAASVFKFDEEYIRKGKFEIEYRTLAYLTFQDLSEEQLEVVRNGRMILQELERIAQFALNIADKTAYVEFENIHDLHKDEYGLKPMGDITAEMIKKAVEAYASGNSKHARETLEMMKEIQELYDKAVEKIKNSVTDSTITSLTGILSILNHVRGAADISCSISSHFC